MDGETVGWVGGGAVGAVIMALAGAVALLWTKRHEIRKDDRKDAREDRKDAADEWRDLVARLNVTIEEMEKRNREQAAAFTKKIEDREAECRKNEVELARLQERLSMYEKGARP